MNYTPLYLQQAMPIVSQHTHYVSNIDLVNDHVDLDMPRYNTDCIADTPHKFLVCNMTDKVEYLFFACKDGYIKTVQYILDSGIDVNVLRVSLTADKTKRVMDSLLTFTLNGTYNSNKLNVIKYLVENGINIDASNNNKEIALYRACKNGYGIDIVRYLVEHGANVNYNDMSGNTVFSIACHSEQSKDVLEYLSDSGANVCYSGYDTNLINICSGMRHTAKTFDIIKTIIECCIKRHGKDFTVQYINARSNMNNNTALSYACTYALSIDTIRYLVEQGANITYLCLQCACKHKQPLDIIRYLVETSNDDIINIQDDDYGMTPLMHACQYNTIDVIQYLVEQGADMSMISHDGYTALGHAYRHLRPRNIIQYLVEQGAKLDSHDNELIQWYNNTVDQ